MYNNIGYMYQDKGDLDKTIEYLNKGLEIQERLFTSQDHEELATTYN